MTNMLLLIDEACNIKNKSGVAENVRSLENIPISVVTTALMQLLSTTFNYCQKSYFLKITVVVTTP